jgi:alpha-1,2-rhamnosyltransferase
MKKIYVDCSFLPENPELNTGIQRVVRQIMRHMENLAAEDDCKVIPVNLSYGQFVPVDVKDLYRKKKKENIEPTHIEQVALFFSSIIENNFFSTRICQKKDFF